MNHTATEDQAIDGLKAKVVEQRAQYKDALLANIALNDEALILAGVISNKLTITREALARLQDNLAETV